MVPERATPMGRMPPIIADAALGAAVAATIAVVLTATAAPASAHLGAYLFALGLGSVLMLRRRAPLLVLGLTVLGVLVYYALDFPPIGLAVPVAAALFCATDEGHPVWSVIGGGIAFAVSSYFRLRDGLPASFLLG